MKKHIIVLSLFLCMNNPLFAMKPGIPKNLEFTHLKTLNNGDNIGWLKVPDYRNAVLINLHQNEAPHIDREGRPNYIYISPAVPSERLPQGLFFWKSTDSNPTIGGHGQAFVNNQPQTGNYNKYQANFYYHSELKRYGWEHGGTDVKGYQKNSGIHFRTHPF